MRGIGITVPLPACEPAVVPTFVPVFFPRALTQDQADGDIERAMKSRLEFGFYAVDGQGGNGERSWVQGAQVSSDVHTGSLYMTSGVGSLLAASSQNRTQRRRVLGDDETARPAESTEQTTTERALRALVPRPDERQRPFLQKAGERLQ